MLTLKKAQEKLSQDEVKTPSQAVAEMIDALQQWCVEECLPSEDVSDSFPSVVLCFNFVELGVGTLTLAPSGFEWTGPFVMPKGSTETPEHQRAENADNKPASFRFPRGILTDVRPKVLAGERSMLMLTVAETIFLQFAFAPGSSCAPSSTEVDLLIAERLHIGTPTGRKRLAVSQTPDHPRITSHDNLRLAQTAVKPRTDTSRFKIPLSGTGNLWRTMRDSGSNAGPSSSVNTSGSSAPTPVDGTNQEALLLELENEVEAQRHAAIEQRDRLVLQAQEDCANELARLEGLLREKKEALLAEIDEAPEELESEWQVEGEMEKPAAANVSYVMIALKVKVGVVQQENDFSADY
ncbi:hypothetical protein HK104_004760 [Borealophlyctis nickersoniae]|nr:hypothetical protein HK104_004760 [Borealophlyctis nickersoniae]